MSPEIQYLESLVELNLVVDRLLTAVQLIIQTGDEGIQEVAKTTPGVILTAFAEMATVIKNQQRAHVKLVEGYLELTDDIDLILSQIDKK